MHSQIVKEGVGLFQSNYATAIVDSLAELDSEFEEQANECYLATAYLMSSNCKRFGQILNEMENNTPGGTTIGPAPW